jgi:hypothetical protein
MASIWKKYLEKRRKEIDFLQFVVVTSGNCMVIVVVCHIDTSVDYTVTFGCVMGIWLYSWRMEIVL